MNLNKPITNTKNNFGLTSLVGGTLQLLFGFSVSFIGIVILAITFGAGIKSITSEKFDASKTIKAKIGMSLSLFAIILYYFFDFSGVILPMFETLL